MAQSGKTSCSLNEGQLDASFSFKDSPRFGEVLDAWLERKKIGLKESSHVKYFNIINAHAKPAFGDFELPDISSASLNGFVSKNRKKGKAKQKKDGQLSEKTLRDIMAVIKSALRFAAEEKLLDDIPILTVIYPRDKKKEMRVFTKDEQAALESYLRVDMNASKLGIFICLYTGLRIGEICSLRWRDISLENLTLTVNSTLQRLQTLGPSAAKTKLTETEPKSSSSKRTIPLPGFLAKMLHAFRPRNQNAYVLTGNAAKFIEPRTYHNHFKAHLAAASIKDASFHSIRHSFATRCVEAGFEIKSLSEILGHANVNITLNRYVHPSLELKRSNMDKLTCLF